MYQPTSPRLYVLAAPVVAERVYRPEPVRRPALTLLRPASVPPERPYAPARVIRFPDLAPLPPAAA